MKTIATYSPSGNTKPLRPFLVVLGERSMIQHAYNVLEVIINLNKTNYVKEGKPFMVRPATYAEEAQMQLL